MDCPICSLRVPDFERTCPGCQADVGFPNVRKATLPEEVAALEQRLKDAYVSVAARGCRATLDAFGLAVNQSSVVMCRSISVVKYLIESENALYVPFYVEVQSGSRLPEDNKWDRGRPAVDGTLFPYYADKIVFGSLSINDRGIGGTYGPYTIVLRDKMITHRTTVFEENPFAFFDRHRVVAGNPVPAGFRACWDDRHKLAMSKLHHKLSAATVASDFPAILQSSAVNSDDADFVEAHIFGKITRTAIKLVAGPRPKKGPDAVLVRSVATKLKQLGATFEETT